MNPVHAHRPPAALFVVTSMVDNWAGEGPAVVQWAVRERVERRLPWPLSTIVADIGELDPAARVSVGQAVDRFFTQEEAEVLGDVLVRDALAWRASIRYGRIALPMAAEEALALQKPNPHRASGTLWRVRPSGSLLLGSPLPIEGIVSLWPWPGLAPDEIAPLMALRERLGLDPIPSANPSGGDAGADESG